MYEIQQRVQLVGDRLTGPEIVRRSREKVIVVQKMTAKCCLIQSKREP